MTVLMNPDSSVSAALQLAAMLRSHVTNDEGTIRLQADQIDAHEPRFSGRMAELYISMGEDRTARRNIRTELNADRSETTTPEEWKDVAQEIIHSVLRDHSLLMLHEYRTAGWNRSKGRYIFKKAEAYIRETSPDLQPDLYSDNLNTIMHYYQSLGIAAYILAGDTMQESLRWESRSFVEWAAVDSRRLALARRCKSINPDDLNELSEIMQQTPVPLDDGVL